MTDEEKKFLNTYDITAFDRPSLTADMAVFAILTENETEEYRKDPAQKLGILLVRREGFPYKGSWALPGGFAKNGESIDETALRELREETGVDSAYLSSFGMFSTPARDPRGWIVSEGFLALVDQRKCRLRAGSDAWEAAWFTVDIRREELKKHVLANSAEIITKYVLTLSRKPDADAQNPEIIEQKGNEAENRIPDSVITAAVEETRTFSNHHETAIYTIIDSDGLAFDHAEIIVRAFQALREKTRTDTIVFDLMPEKFTLYSLQAAYEIILGESLTTPNFRRKIAPYVVETDEMTGGAGHRPAKLFKRNLDTFYRDTK